MRYGDRQQIGGTPKQTKSTRDKKKEAKANSMVKPLEKPKKEKSKGLTEKQKKLPEKLQKAILKKKNKKK